jgi:hypothetical protein
LRRLLEATAWVTRAMVCSYADFEQSFNRKGNARMQGSVPNHLMISDVGLQIAD